MPRKTRFDRERCRDPEWGSCDIDERLDRDLAFPDCLEARAGCRAELSGF